MNDLINGILLFFVVGIGSIYIFNEIVIPEPIPSTSTAYNANTCKNKVERPRKIQLGVESSQGYDCMD